MNLWGFLLFKLLYFIFVVVLFCDVGDFVMIFYEIFFDCLFKE